MWLAEGLRPPAAVIEATNEYLEGEDALGRWIEERCVLGEGREAGTIDAFNDFREWCRENNEAKGKDWSQRKFTGEMRAHGYEPAKDRASRTVRVFRGIELLVGAEDYEIIDAMTEHNTSMNFFGFEVTFDDDEDDDDEKKRKR